VEVPAAQATRISTGKDRMVFMGDGFYGPEGATRA
jgi:hypothetical protein